MGRDGFLLARQLVTDISECTRNKDSRFAHFEM
jgi:hypothetical protein